MEMNKTTSDFCNTNRIVISCSCQNCLQPLEVQKKSNRRSIHLTNPCIAPLWLEHLLFSALAIDMSIYVKDKNSSTEKVISGITSPLCFQTNSVQDQIKAYLWKVWAF